MSATDILIKELANTINENQSKKPAPYDTTAEVIRIEGNTAWVHIPGGIDETPVQLTTNAKKGDVVQVRVSGGQAWITGNATSPPTDDTTAKEAKKTAIVADEHASDAISSASLAQKYADEAMQDAATAHTAAISAQESAASAASAATAAQTRADEAYQSAYEAGVAAETADGKAQTAITNAGIAQTAADTAQSMATNAQASASTAQEAANDALDDAATAHDEAIEAQRLAGVAQTSAEDAQDAAEIADGKAVEAINSARTANIAASGAIESLSIVEDVLGVLNWISEHATYKLTEDESPVPGKYYFQASGNTYSIVNVPSDADPHSLGYYEIDDIEEAVSNFVSTHLALANEGLYIQTAAGDATSRMLVSPTGGIVLYGPDGEAVATYGTSTIIGNADDFHIEITNQEVGFYDGQTRVAYISNQTLYITQSVVLDEMQLGNKKWSWKYDNRDDSIFLKWIG